MSHSPGPLRKGADKNHFPGKLGREDEIRGESALSTSEERSHKQTQGVITIIMPQLKGQASDSARTH